MFELSFSDPPIVYVRLGLIVDARNALGPGSFDVSKVILVGQVLVQLPPRDTGAPAILKLLIDVVGFYDDDTGFLLVRARLRDSFVGIEGFTKLDLAGELLVAVQFGADEGFVLSAGGFHPRYQGLPGPSAARSRQAARELQARPGEARARAVRRRHAELGAGRSEGVDEGRFQGGLDRGIARLRRAVVPLAAQLLPRRHRVQRRR